MTGRARFKAGCPSRGIARGDGSARPGSCIAALDGDAMTLIDRLHRTGICRLGNKKSGFRYEIAGEAVSVEDRERIDALKLPPAWRDVAIALSPRAAVQAVGLDAAGRWQYRYHPAHERRREKKKEERLRRFGKAL